jgi:hypothetical protein
MKHIAFHSNELNIRGTNVALYDYAHYNETILGNKSYIISNANVDLQALPKFKNRFEVFLYNDFKESEQFTKERGIEYVYYIKAGNIDNKILSNVKNLVHAVFQFYQPHGERYVYIAEWIAEKMCKDKTNFVPHIISLPEPTLDLREKLNIPANATVFGRHGGYDEFNFDFAKKAVVDTVIQRKDCYFVFMNTKPFCKHDRIFFIEGTYNLQNKANYISMCDAMIHARQHGEVFSLSMGEFLYFNKPIISCIYGLDSGHHHMLRDCGLWYKNYEECFNHLTNFDKTTTPSGKYKKLVSEYTPENVMKRFNDKFLK